MRQKGRIGLPFCLLKLDDRRFVILYERKSIRKTGQRYLAGIAGNAGSIRLEEVLKKPPMMVQALFDATEVVALRKMLEEATEHHCLTVVRMALRDLKGDGYLRGAMERLWSDLDKMRCSSTPEGKKLCEYLSQKWKTQQDTWQKEEVGDDD